MAVTASVEGTGRPADTGSVIDGRGTGGAGDCIPVAAALAWAIGAGAAAAWVTSGDVRPATLSDIRCKRLTMASEGSAPSRYSASASIVARSSKNLRILIFRPYSCS